MCVINLFTYNTDTMKIQKIRLFGGLLAFTLIGVFFTGCEPEETVQTGMITFEDVSLDSTGYWNGSDLSGTFSSYEKWGMTINEYAGSFVSGALTCYTIFDDYGYGSTSWTGIACSNHTNMDSVGYTNQYSVYASSGANGSSQFGLVYSDGASCRFKESVTVKSLMINNSTYAYWALKDGNDGAGFVRQFAAGDYFYVTITGYDSTGIETGHVDAYLADFRDGQTYICDAWTEVSLTQLGQVEELTFNFVSTDVGDCINTPAYACIDNLVYTKE